MYQAAEGSGHATSYSTRIDGTVPNITKNNVSA